MLEFRNYLAIQTKRRRDNELIVWKRFSIKNQLVLVGVTLVYYVLFLRCGTTYMWIIMGKLPSYCVSVLRILALQKSYKTIGDEHLIKGQLTNGKIKCLVIKTHQNTGLWYHNRILKIDTWTQIRRKITQLYISQKIYSLLKSINNI